VILNRQMYRRVASANIVLQLVTPMNRVFMGGTLKKVEDKTWKECAEECDKSTACYAFSYETEAKKCYLKEGSNGVAVYKEGFVHSRNCGTSPFSCPAGCENSDGCCKGIKVIGHGVSGLSDPLNLELGTDGIYATGDSTHTLQVINGLTQLVKSDDLTNVLCYAKNRNTCMDRDVAYSCFKTAKIRGFASRWQNNYDMKVECVNMC